MLKGHDVVDDLGVLDGLEVCDQLLFPDGMADLLGKELLEL